ncbi:MAG TPA: dihydrodipicolinate synthase family protein, partial [Chitinophagaceae bacterium]|nr:dihydrodipicolinate synthase family protein [Chitinophagaceae bacterium]
MNIQHLTGLVAAPFTPLDKEGKLNLSIIPEYYQFLKSNRVKGAFINGSTGEGVSMTANEKMQVMDAWAACTKDDKDFIVMALLGGTSITDCKELAIHAQKTGIDAISFTAPFYFKPPTVKELAACCIEIASVVPNLPFYYYHIPVLNGVNFSM